MKTSLLILFLTTFIFFACALIASYAYHNWSNKQRRQLQVSSTEEFVTAASLSFSSNKPDEASLKPHFKAIVMDAGISGRYPF